MNSTLPTLQPPLRLVTLQTLQMKPEKHHLKRQKRKLRQQPQPQMLTSLQ
jgi:hypothetical protein